MTTQEMVDGLREIAAKAAKVKEDPCIDNAREMFAATAHVVNHAAAIADELERLRGQVNEARRHVSRLVDVCRHAGPGAFRDGVTDPTGTIDQGEVLCGQAIAEATDFITSIWAYKKENSR